MDKKRCIRCEEDKPPEEFGWKNKAALIRAGYCRECNKEYQRKHYRKNKEIYSQRAKDYRHTAKKKLFEYMLDKSCVDCGESRRATLQFDHVRGKKEYAIAAMVFNYKWENTIKEIAKCDIRCANCHAIKTAEQCGWYGFMT